MTQGGVDIAQSLGPRDRATPIRLPEVKMADVQGGNVDVSLNCTVERFKDRTVRQALGYSATSKRPSIRTSSAKPYVS